MTAWTKGFHISWQVYIIWTAVYPGDKTNIQQLLPFRYRSGKLLELVATAQLEGVLVAALLVVVAAVLVELVVRGLGARQLGGWWWVLLLRPFFLVGGGEVFTSIEGDWGAGVLDTVLGRLACCGDCGGNLYSKLQEKFDSEFSETKT